MAKKNLHFFISKTFHQIFSAKIFHRKLSTQNVPPKLPTSIIMNSHSLVSLVHLPSFPQEYLSFVMWVFFEIWRKILHLDWCFPYFKDKEPNNLKAKTLSEEWNGFFHSRYLFSTWHFNWGFLSSKWKPEGGEGVTETGLPSILSACVRWIYIATHIYSY